MQTIKRLSEDLAITGHFLSDDELIIHVLNRLRSEFMEICAAIRAWDSTIYFEELHDKLWDQEMNVKCEAYPITSPVKAQFH